MATDVVIPAESSAAEAIPNFNPETYTRAERDHWMKTGDLPVSKAESTHAQKEAVKEKADVVANSEDASEEVAQPDGKEGSSPPPAGTAKAGEPAPESAPGKQQQEHKGKNADARKAELHGEIQELLGKRTQVKKEWEEFETWKAKKPDEVAAPSSVPKEKKVELPVKPELGAKPVIGDDESYADFDARLEAWRADHAAKLETWRETVTEIKIKEALAADREANEKARIEAVTKAENKRIEDAWQAKVVATAEELGVSEETFRAVAFVKELTISPVMDQFIADSDIGPMMVHYLATHLSEAKPIASMSPYRAARALRDLEVKLISGPTPTKEEAHEPPKKAHAVIPVTKAAKPATDLKARNEAPVNEKNAAIEAGDFTRFNEIEDQEILARRKRG